MIANKRITLEGGKYMRENHKTLPVVEKLSNAEETVWINLKKLPSAKKDLEISMADIDDAEARLERFAPFIMKWFPYRR